MQDIKGIEIQIGDIVKIENSPIKSDNATYVVYQDGTSKGYSSKDLTLYRVAKHKNGYTMSSNKYNICFYPLHSYSNKYKFTRQELDAATIEIILKADSSIYNLVKSDDKYEMEKTEKTYFTANLKKDNEIIEDASYPVDEVEKLTAFFANITPKQGEYIEITKHDYSWGYYNNYCSYKLESAKQLEEVKTIEQPETTKPEEAEQQEINNLTYEVIEDIDTRDNTQIFIVKVKERLSKEDYITVNNQMKSIGGYYSKFKKGFLFKENPTKLLNSETIEQTEETVNSGNKQTQQTQEDPQKEVIKSIEYEIIEEKHIKTDSDVWLVKIKSSLSKDDFAEVKRKLAILKGFYSSMKEGFIFNYNPTEVLII